jgi:hypothetical protein
MIKKEKQGLIKIIELYSIELLKDSLFKNELVNEYSELIKLNIKNLVVGGNDKIVREILISIDYYIFTIKHHIKMNSIRVKKDVYNNVIFFNEMVNELTFKLK